MAQIKYTRVRPAFQEDGRYVCPVCGLRDNLYVADYGLAKDRSKGMFWFLMRCRRCSVEFEVQANV